ncbi:Crp/Fnr family transcriptional regulator [Algibacter lectus]|uniref:Transcriptional regulator n=2 Tax=Algibacter lectus TaxID=221126 RepID=A0A090VF03_9FLAO|nr:Crp/Fnr family transcriptional regulator [Algibacter lectus]MDO7135792.1 Crp/Fnr family transcriptional regulator [Algibacter lectus]TDY64360.1 CRP/FNR family transcriptional regulator [Algibacter lectus]GAL62648.1 transcriptional regulator [Algibacter lectus]SFC06550.1 CRP/FNR family transcriptional regulator, anaerobic regulatory protein [Algibacter lectus]
MKAITKYWFLEDFNLFKKLGTFNMMKIVEILEMDNIEKGKAINLNDEHKNSVFFLKKGSVKIVNKTNNTVKYVLKRGNIFGELALYDKKAASEEIAYALEDCVICYIESEQMEVLMEKHKSLKNGVLKIYGLRIQKLERRLHNLLYKDSVTRIKEFIADYLEEFGESNEGGHLTAKNLLSHKEIANLTNTSRQTVSNVLSTMRKEGIIDYNIEFISSIK